MGFSRALVAAGILSDGPHTIWSDFCGFQGDLMARFTQADNIRASAMGISLDDVQLERAIAERDIAWQVVEDLRASLHRMADKRSSWRFACIVSWGLAAGFLILRCLP